MTSQRLFNKFIIKLQVDKKIILHFAAFPSVLNTVKINTYHPFRTNSKISYKVGNLHSSPSPRRETAAADLITAYKIFTGVLDVDPNLLFLPPTRRGLRGNPYKVL